jgi:hypothetical protein
MVRGWSLVKFRDPTLLVSGRRPSEKCGSPRNQRKNVGRVVEIFVCVCGSRYLKIIHIENWMGLEIASSVGPLLLISAWHAHDVYFW